MLVKSGSMPEMLRYCKNLRYELHKVFDDSNSYIVLFIGDINYKGKKKVLNLEYKYICDTTEHARKLVEQKRVSMFWEAFNNLEKNLNASKSNKNAKDIIDKTINILG
ncbi:hypothetical protein UT300012_21980 [Paraclostridium bifermentans]